jgi:hypothetical protein
MIQISKILLSGSRMELYWLNLTAHIGISAARSPWPLCSPPGHLTVIFSSKWNSESASVELFAFAEDDTALGPFGLVHVIKSAVIAEMKSNTAAADYGLVFSSHPAMTIDNQGLVCLWLQAVSQNGPDSPVYETIIQVHGVAGSLSAKRQFNQAL